MTPLDAAPSHPTLLGDPTRGVSVAQMLRAAPPDYSGEAGPVDEPAAAPKSFAAILSQRMKSEQTPAQVRDEVYRNVEELVARTLVAPILEKLGEDPLNSGLFERGHAEKALRPLLEAEVAKDIVAGMRTGFVDHVARRLLASRQQASLPPATAADTSEQGPRYA